MARKSIHARIVNCLLRRQSIAVIAERFKISEAAIERLVAEVQKRCETQEERAIARHKRRLEAGIAPMYGWLDPMDEANVFGYYVPTPEEIAAEARKINDRYREAMLSE